MGDRSVRLDCEAAHEVTLIGTVVLILPCPTPIMLDRDSVVQPGSACSVGNIAVHCAGGKRRLQQAI